jgi:protein-S-isoprenylcysteine O-methyltransferase Ste14
LHIVLAALARAIVGVRISAEEGLLVARYPEYAAYASKTKRVVPFVL